MLQELKMECPCCGSRETRIVPLKDGDGQNRRLARCRNCSLVRTIHNSNNQQPLKTPDHGVYYGRGANKFVPVIQELRDRLMRARAEKYLRLVPSTVKKPRVLDVGCAEGRLLRALLELGCECWGVEHPAYPEERFHEAERITYLKGNLDELVLDEDGFDLIFLWHVLEHLDEPGQTLRRLCEILRPEGSIILAVPNFASLERRCFNENWFHLDVPWHQWHFSERSLGYLFNMTGLKICEMTSLCLEQGPYGLIQSLLNAMGWPKNEAYEALKGQWTSRRLLPLAVQFGLVGLLAIPGFLASALASFEQKGSVLTLILKRNRGL